MAAITTKTMATAVTPMPQLRHAFCTATNCASSWKYRLVAATSLPLIPYAIAIAIVTRPTTGMKPSTMYKMPRPIRPWFINQNGHNKNAPQFHMPMNRAPGPCAAGAPHAAPAFHWPCGPHWPCDCPHCTGCGVAAGGAGAVGGIGVVDGVAGGCTGGVYIFTRHGVQTPVVSGGPHAGQYCGTFMESCDLLGEDDAARFGAVGRFGSDDAARRRDGAVAAPRANRFDALRIRLRERHDVAERAQEQLVVHDVIAFEERVLRHLAHARLEVGTREAVRLLHELVQQRVAD